MMEHFDEWCDRTNPSRTFRVDDVSDPYFELLETGFAYTSRDCEYQFYALRNVKVPLDGSQPYIDTVYHFDVSHEATLNVHDPSAPFQPGDSLRVGKHPICWQTFQHKDVFEGRVGFVREEYGGFAVMNPKRRRCLLGDEIFAGEERTEKKHPGGLLPFRHIWSPGEPFGEVMYVSDSCVFLRLLKTNEKRAFKLNAAFKDAFTVAVHEEGEV
jgi:hypothetical protein